MKKLSREEMKHVVGGSYAPPATGCYGRGVKCTFPYPSQEEACCGGLECLPAGPVTTCQPS